MNSLRESLERKLGPLPVWIWAVIGGIATYVYRTRRAVGGGLGGAVPSVTAPDASATTGSDGGASSDPVTLQPGESVYDPATGQLIGTAPEQTPVDGGTPPADVTPLEPVTLEPGEGVYDPGTGKILGNPAGTPGTKKAKKKTRRSKTTAKAKPKHTKSVAKQTKPGRKSKTRSVAKLLTPKRSKSKGGSSPGRVRGTRGGGAKAPSSRIRAKAATVTAPAIRQRPAAPRVVQPATQKVSPHPAPHAVTAPHPAARPPSRPAPAPPRARGRKK